MIDDRKFMSFGGGVQSTAIVLLLLNKPEIFTDKGITLPKHLIFADTGAEPPQVYEHISKIRQLLKDSSHKLYTVRSPKGSIDATEKNLGTVSWFTKNPDTGDKAILKRQCTHHFKITPIHNKIREIIGLRKGEKIDKPITLWLGISTDEQQRAKSSIEKWLTLEYPLLLIDWSRVDCTIYNTYLLGYEVSKSSCYFCPFTNKNEWIRRKEHEPELFAKAVSLDNQLRLMNEFTKLKHDVYLHRSRLPLSEAVEENMVELELGFLSECKGVCGN